VHDAGEYKDGDEWKKLQPGMVLTLEPGCYIRPAEDVPEAFWNIGVRIEDDAVVTADGCRLLTRDVPVEIAEIEALIQEGRA
jgi:Xaa-Pro aminopeptidase